MTCKYKRLHQSHGKKRKEKRICTRSSAIRMHSKLINIETLKLTHEALVQEHDGFLLRQRSKVILIIVAHLQTFTLIIQ